MVFVRKKWLLDTYKKEQKITAKRNKDLADMLLILLRDE